MLNPTLLRHYPQSLHIHRATSLHTRLVDLSASTSEEESNYLGSYLPGYMRIKSSTNFADMAEEINELNESNFREPNTYVEDFSEHESAKREQPSVGQLDS